MEIGASAISRLPWQKGRGALFNSKNIDKILLSYTSKELYSLHAILIHFFV
jgi:hypothetical protein